MYIHDQVCDYSSEILRTVEPTEELGFKPGPLQSPRSFCGIAMG